MYAIGLIRSNKQQATSSNNPGHTRGAYDENDTWRARGRQRGDAGAERGRTWTTRLKSHEEEGEATAPTLTAMQDDENRRYGDNPPTEAKRKDRRKKKPNKKDTGLGNEVTCCQAAPLSSRKKTCYSRVVDNSRQIAGQGWSWDAGQKRRLCMSHLRICASVHHQHRDNARHLAAKGSDSGQVGGDGVAQGGFLLLL